MKRTRTLADRVYREFKDHEKIEDWLEWEQEGIAVAHDFDHISFGNVIAAVETKIFAMEHAFPGKFSEVGYSRDFSERLADTAVRIKNSFVSALSSGVSVSSDYTRLVALKEELEVFQTCFDHVRAEFPSHSEMKDLLLEAVRGRGLKDLKVAMCDMLGDSRVKDLFSASAEGEAFLSKVSKIREGFPISQSAMR